MRDERRAPLFILLFIYAYVFTSCTKLADRQASQEAAVLTPIKTTDTNTDPGGNGQGYGGGDTILSGMRTLLVWSLKRYQAGFEQGLMANVQNCASLHSSVLCQRVNNLTNEQRDFVNDFLRLTVGDIISMNVGNNPTKLVVTSEQLILKSSTGAMRDLGAMTKMGPEGEIMFSESSLIVINDREKIALLAHEFGHKVLFNGKYISDVDPIGPFAGTDGGRKFLDAFGAALAGYFVQTEDKATITTGTKASCDRRGLTLDLELAPYFSPPPEGETKSQQSSKAALDFLNEIDTGDFSISLWASLDESAAQTNTSESTNKVLLGTKDSDDAYMGGLSLFRGANGNFWIYAGNDKGVDTGQLISGGAYHHIVAIKNGNSLFSFVDGVKGTIPLESRYINEFDSADISPGTLSSYLTAAQVGRLGNPAQSYWQGKIAHIQLINKAITDSDVQLLYQCGK